MMGRVRMDGLGRIGWIDRELKDWSWWMVISEEKRNNDYLPFIFIVVNPKGSIAK